MDNGIIYIMNTTIDGISYIDTTSDLDAIQENRLYYDVGITTLYYAVDVPNIDRKMQIIGSLFNTSRIGFSDGLYVVDKQLLKGLLQEFEGEQVYPIITAYDKAVNNEDMKPKIVLEDIGIVSGDILAYYEDKNITCEVYENNLVRYEGKIYSIDSLICYLKSNELSGFDYNPAYYLTYEGKRLVDIYESEEFTYAKTSERV